MKSSQICLISNLSSVLLGFNNKPAVYKMLLTYTVYLLKVFRTVSYNKIKLRLIHKKYNVRLNFKYKSE